MYYYIISCNINLINSYFDIKPVLSDVQVFYNFLVMLMIL